MKVYLVWSSWAGDPPELCKIFMLKSDALDFKNKLYSTDSYVNDYWITEEDVINDSSG